MVISIKHLLIMIFVCFYHSLSHVNSFILMQLLWVQYENFIIPTKIIHALSETWTEIVISDLRIILQFNIWHIAFKRTWENDSWWVWQNYPLEKDVINISWNSYFFVFQWCKKWMHLSISLPSLYLSFNVVQGWISIVIIHNNEF